MGNGLVFVAGIGNKEWFCDLTKRISIFSWYIRARLLKYIVSHWLQLIFHQAFTVAEDSLTVILSLSHRVPGLSQWRYFCSSIVTSIYRSIYRYFYQFYSYYYRTDSSCFSGWTQLYFCKLNYHPCLAALSVMWIQEADVQIHYSGLKILYVLDKEEKCDGETEGWELKLNISSWNYCKTQDRESRMSRWRHF